jgi:hypothetical protein
VHEQGALCQHSHQKRWTADDVHEQGALCQHIASKSLNLSRRACVQYSNGRLRRASGSAAHAMHAPKAAGDMTLLHANVRCGIT